MTNRPAVTPALLEEYCKKFRNWGRWGAEEVSGAFLALVEDGLHRRAPRGQALPGKIRRLKRELQSVERALDA